MTLEAADTDELDVLTGKRILFIRFYSDKNWERLEFEVNYFLSVRGCETENFFSGQFRFPKVGPRIVSKQSGSKRLSSERLTSVSPSESWHLSERFTFFRDPNPKGLGPWVYSKIVTKRLERFAERFEAVLISGNFDFVIIPNGRLTLQKAAIAICSRNRVRPLFIETRTFDSHPTERFFFRPYPIHSRVSRQAEITGLDVNADAARDVFYEWIEPRMTSNGRNRYASRWQTSVKPAEIKHRPAGWNIFLTTSTDELFALGEEWEQDSWQDQYEAFSRVLTKLEQMGERKFILKMHPNLANKAPAFVRSEIARVNWLLEQHPDLIVVGPTSEINTYSLLRDCKRLFVSVSKTAVEASGLGIPTWCTSANDFDESIDVTRLLRDSDVTQDRLGIRVVDDSRAHKFVMGSILSGPSYEITVAEDKAVPVVHLRHYLNGDLPLRLIFSAAKRTGLLISALRIRLFERGQRWKIQITEDNTVEMVKSNGPRIRNQSGLRS